MVKRSDVIRKYEQRASKLKPDKSIAVGNVLGSYSLEYRDRSNNGYNLVVDGRMYKWTAACQNLMRKGLQELYDLHDKGVLEDE